MYLSKTLTSLLLGLSLNYGVLAQDDGVPRGNAIPRDDGGVPAQKPIVDNRSTSTASSPVQQKLDGGLIGQCPSSMSCRGTDKQIVTEYVGIPSTSTVSSTKYDTMTHTTVQTVLVPHVTTVVRTKVGMCVTLSTTTVETPTTVLVVTTVTELRHQVTSVRSVKDITTTVYIDDDISSCVQFKNENGKSSKPSPPKSSENPKPPGNAKNPGAGAAIPRD